MLEAVTCSVASYWPPILLLMRIRAIAILVIIKEKGLLLLDIVVLCLVIDHVIVFRLAVFLRLKLTTTRIIFKPFTFLLFFHYVFCDGKILRLVLDK